jgi:hypothetical protein
LGSTDGSIRIDYGYINQAADTSFHTRQITFPVLFTVYHTLELHDLDIMRFAPSAVSASDRAREPVSAGDELRTALDREADGEHCLVALMVRNVYGVPFEVSLSRLNKADESDLRVTRLVPPGASERYVPLLLLGRETEMLIRTACSSLSLDSISPPR